MFALHMPRKITKPTELVARRGSFGFRAGKTFFPRSRCEICSSYRIAANADIEIQSRTRIKKVLVNL